jgi:hypothetical protein
VWCAGVAYRGDKASARGGGRGVGSETGFGESSHGAEFEGATFDGCVATDVVGANHHRQRVLLHDALEKIKAVHAGHIDVHHDNIGGFAAHDFDGLKRRCSRAEYAQTVIGRKQVGKDLAGDGGVIDDEDGAGHGCGGRRRAEERSTSNIQR